MDGRDHYLGRYGSPESREKYHRLIAEWLAGESEGGKTLRQSRSSDQLTVSELIQRYHSFVIDYYRKDGKPTSEQACIKAALRHLRELYGALLICDFGPLCLKAVRAQMLARGNARYTINKNIARIKRLFAWGLENELVPVGVHQALQAVAGLRRGKSSAKELLPVVSVEDESVEAILPHIPPIVGAMVSIQLLTGCRPTEVCILRPGDVDREGDVWCYSPGTHKTEHHDIERRIYVGPRAQTVLVPFLNRESDNFCFSPRESAEWERDRSRISATPIPRPRHGRRGERYTRDSYRRAIRRGCEAAGVPIWSPNQLRHNRATKIRKGFGLEASQCVLGHAKADITEIYAERNFLLAQQVMGQIG
ncbi:MAG: site-specific integrase [Rhodopirellula sp.]|nr:site-specific integrase [Rhodopirellula sp.]